VQDETVLLLEEIGERFKAVLDRGEVDGGQLIGFELRAVGARFAQRTALIGFENGVEREGRDRVVPQIAERAEFEIQMQRAVADAYGIDGQFRRDFHRLAERCGGPGRCRTR